MITPYNVTKTLAASLINCVEWTIWTDLTFIVLRCSLSSCCVGLVTSVGRWRPWSSVVDRTTATTTTPGPWNFSSRSCVHTRRMSSAASYSSLQGRPDYPWEVRKNTVSRKPHSNGSFTLTETDSGTHSDSDCKPNGYIVLCRTSSHCTNSDSYFYFCVGQESKSVPESISGNVNEPWEVVPEAQYWRDANSHCFKFERDFCFLKVAERLWSTVSIAVMFQT